MSRTRDATPRKTGGPGTPESARLVGARIVEQESQPCAEIPATRGARQRVSGHPARIVDVMPGGMTLTASGTP